MRKRKRKLCLGATLPFTIRGGPPGRETLCDWVGGGVTSMPRADPGAHPVQLFQGASVSAFGRAFVCENKSAWAVEKFAFAAALINGSPNLTQAGPGLTPPRAAYG
jgi:hypothetical protein